MEPFSRRSSAGSSVLQLWLLTVLAVISVSDVEEAALTASTLLVVSFLSLLVTSS